MKNTKVTLVPLTADDREIISRKTIERCIDSPDSETYTRHTESQSYDSRQHYTHNKHCGEDC